MTLSFREYIQHRRVSDSAAGDFVSDAQRDRDLPDAKTWPELRRYLEHRHAIPEAIAAGYEVWKAYQRLLKKTAT